VVEVEVELCATTRQIDYISVCVIYQIIVM